MIKIKICDVNPKGACSFYRGLGVFQKLHKINNLIDVKYIDGVNWNELSDCDILYLMRPCENNYIETLKLAKDFNVIVWSDYDDILHEVPIDNPSYSYFNQDRIQKNIEFAIQNSDIVTVSTNYIKEYYTYLNTKIKVIENAFNNYNFKLELKDNNIKRISWRGSQTHRNDLLSCKIDMNNIHTKHPDWEWIFIGCDPWYVTEDIKNSITVGELEVIKFNRLISDITPAIHIIPLADTSLNKGKSNISWIEGTYAGACCIAPDYPEFQNIGCVTYKDNFEYLLDKCIKSKSFRQENYKKSFEYINENLLLSNINQKRIQIIEEVI